MAPGITVAPSSRGSPRERKGRLPGSSKQVKKLVASAMFTARFSEPLVWVAGGVQLCYMVEDAGQAPHTFKAFVFSSEQWENDC